MYGTGDDKSGTWDGEPDPGTRDQGAPGTADGRAAPGTVRLLATTLPGTGDGLAPVTVLCSVRVYTRGY